MSFVAKDPTVAMQLAKKRVLRTKNIFLCSSTVFNMMPKRWL